ncbi:MAG: DUF378 domain-containing protein [Candidatus Paceibacterota bacterium]|jgi:hypothetical protein
MKLSIIDWIAIGLVVIGGLNWGLVGAMQYNLVDSLLGAGSTISAIVYDLVGIGALWVIVVSFKCCPKKSEQPMM